MKNNRVSQSGRSMVEMLAVIAVIGILTVGSIATVSYVDSYFRTNATALEINKQADDIMDLYSWSKSFAKNDTALMATACREDVFETCVNNQPTNIWGGNITLNGCGDDRDGFKITYASVPQTACERLWDAHADGVFKVVALENAGDSAEEYCADESRDMVFSYNCR